MIRSFFHVPAALIASSSARKKPLQDERDELQRSPTLFHDIVPRDSKYGGRGHLLILGGESAN